MFSMQYAIPLPTDYDMGIISKRVKDSGHCMNGFADLNFKAFLMREKSAGAPRNEYAPFYLWNEISGVSDFILKEPGFSSIVKDFGRPPIQNWELVEEHRSNADSVLAEAQSLSIESFNISEGVAIADVVAEERNNWLLVPEEGIINKFLLVDTNSWELSRVALSVEKLNQEQIGTRRIYQVLYVAEG